MEDRSTFRNSARIILKVTGRPMKAEEIVEAATKIGILQTNSANPTATMRYALEEIYRSGKEKDSDLRKVGPNLWELNVAGISSVTSSLNGTFNIGDTYSRSEIAKILQTSDATINNGVFRPKGRDFVLIFVTEKKTKDRTPYADFLNGDILYWDGQSMGRTDSFIIYHQELDLELNLFYRMSKQERSDHSFRFLGRLSYVDHSGSKPTHFILKLIDLSKLRNPLDDKLSFEATFTTGLEGKATVSTVTRYERDRQLRESALKVKGATCSICSFDFGLTYGKWGEGFAEVHHVVPLSKTKEERITGVIDDLAVVCSNCHSMLHRTRNAITPEELKAKMSEGQLSF